MNSADLKRDLVHADLIRDLAHAREAQRKLFAAIVRHVQRREATGPKGAVMEQIRRDKKLCKLLVDYEERSEIVGMMDFVLDQNRTGSPPKVHQPSGPGQKCILR
jgi:hypothetical protein